ncbi:MAG: TolC family protein, partial [Proteobacteria bacterium]|nr:TolC family protein [Pseudomonadota bacterium]
MSWLPAVVLAALVVAPIRARAEDVTLAEAVAALPNAPATPVATFELAGAQASVAAAGAWPDPAVRLETNRLTARVVAGVSVPLAILGTVDAARREATAHVDTVRAEGELARRELRRRVVLAWLDLARADAAARTQVVVAQQTTELERIARGRFDQGAGAEVDVASAHAARARA